MPVACTYAAGRLHHVELLLGLAICSQCLAEVAALEAICHHIAFALNQVAKAIMITDSL